MIAAGGTGGHVYPALAVAEAIRTQQPAAKLAFVGSVDGFERPLVEKASLRFDSYDEVRAGPVHGVSLPRLLYSVVQLMLGTLQAIALVLRRKPDVLLLTGGWVGFPVALAAWLLRVPSLIYLPDIEPGLTIRVLKRFAARVAVTTPESQPYFRPGQMVVTGYPLRASMRVPDRTAGIAQFGLDPARVTLLVFGGSRGARSLNHALLDALPELLTRADVQIVHITGTLDWEAVGARIAALPDTTHYHPFPYLHDEMPLAYAAADLVLSRSGASTLGELPYFGLPAILVPYPYAWRYQKVNADYLADRGAAVVMRDEDMARDLLPTLRALLDDTARRESMRAAARALAIPDAAARIAAELMKLTGKHA